MKRQEAITTGLDKRWKVCKGIYRYRNMIAIRDLGPTSQRRWVVKSRHAFGWNDAALSYEFNTLQECLLEIDRMIDKQEEKTPSKANLQSYAEIQNSAPMTKGQLLQEVLTKQGLVGSTDCTIPQGFLNELADYATEQKWCLNLFSNHADRYHAIRTFLAYHYPAGCGGFGEPIALCREVQDLLDAYNQMLDELTF